MKLIRYGALKQEKPGLYAPDGSYRDLSSIVTEITAQSVLDLLEQNLDWQSLPVVDASVRLGVPISAVGSFYAIGLNYVDHAIEAGMPIPEHPILFQKAVSSLAGPNDDLPMPLGSDALDWEVELGVVIAKTARHVSVEHARDYVLGYLLVNDISERTWQLQRGGAQWDKGKSHEGFGPVGPWLVTRDEIADPDNLDLWLDVNGQAMQRGNTKTMVFNLDQIIADLSKYVTLCPGDIITTGTPPGVGMGLKPPRYLAKGDVMTLGVEGLGTQRQRII